MKTTDFSFKEFQTLFKNLCAFFVVSNVKIIVNINNKTEIFLAWINFIGKALKLLRTIHTMSPRSFQSHAYTAFFCNFRHRSKNRLNFRKSLFSLIFWIVSPFVVIVRAGLRSNKFCPKFSSMTQMIGVFFRSKFYFFFVRVNRIKICAQERNFNTVRIKTSADFRNNTVRQSTRITVLSFNSLCNCKLNSVKSPFMGLLS